MVGKTDVYGLSENDDVEKRLKLVKQLQNKFSNVEDKEQAWKKMLEIARDTESNIRRDIAYALGIVFSYVKNKEQAWEDIIELTRDDDRLMRKSAASALSHAYLHMDYNEKVTEDFLELTNNL